MKSKINITEFSKSVQNNTKYGNPKIKGTPLTIFTVFGDTNKVFFGTYNKTKFELTKNATFFPTPFIISGEIKTKNNNQTEIIYEVKPIRFGYYWLKYLPLIGIFIFNLILYTESVSLENFLVMNLIFNILSYFYLWQKKKVF